ncbi:helix-hairpin-helix domain-containing protein [Nocardiopsis kunsanensis]|uniref:helix-hairpin-helix domain-containing protein n=1 Tax=Nocardiopsis kunsanensis TaxID=141693 RepID=UPI00034D694D|nr:helix-hairpin-helix domain-containing protein [Nocardiopsis kunsanensis]
MSEAAEQVRAVLDRMGAPPALAPSLLSVLGPHAASGLDADPWLLLRLPQVSVEQADYCARRHLGDRARPDDPRRSGALAAHVLRRAAARGHTAVEDKRLITMVGGLGVPDPSAAVAAAEEREDIVLFESTDDTDDDFDPAEGGVPEVPDPERHYALPDVGRSEQRLGEQLLRLIGGNDPIMDSATAGETVEAATGTYGFTLTDATREALVTATLRPVTVLRQGPSSLPELARAVLCLHMIAQDSRVGLAVAAPTAQAAAALQQAVAELVPEPPVRVVSLAALLERAPFESGLVVLTEAMSVGAARASELVSSCTDGAHLVLCADPHQAPSASPGQVAIDVATSRTAHVARLGEGPADPIAELAAGVAAGEVPDVQAPGREVVRVSASSAEEAAHRAVQLVTDSFPRALGIDPEHAQVVTAREEGPAGAQALNAAFKERLNPGRGFGSGDRVMTASGDQGYLRGFAEGSAVVELADGTRTTVPDPASLRHAWAVPVAAAHGGLWPAVAVVLPPETPVSRPQVYTALTRATQHVSLVDATGGALEPGVRENASLERTTRLVSVLREG